MIQKLIDEAIAADRNKERVSSGKFSAGDAGRCHLYRFWKRKGVVGKEIETRVFRVFQVGHLTEWWILKLLEKYDLLAGRQVLVENHHIKGYIDAIVRTEEGLALIDIKSVNSRKFHWNRKEGWEGDLHYKYQLLTYHALLPSRFKTDDLRLIYVSKDDLCIEEIGVSLSLHDACMKDWESLIQWWEVGAEPEPTEGVNVLDWECTYCSYLEMCEFGTKKVETKKKGGKKDGMERSIKSTSNRHQKEAR